VPPPRPRPRARIPTTAARSRGRDADGPLCRASRVTDGTRWADSAGGPSGVKWSLRRGAVQCIGPAELRTPVAWESRAICAHPVDITHVAGDDRRRCGHLTRPSRRPRRDGALRKRGAPGRRDLADPLVGSPSTSGAGATYILPLEPSPSPDRPSAQPDTIGGSRLTQMDRRAASQAHGRGSSPDHLRVAFPIDAPHAGVHAAPFVGALDAPSPRSPREGDLDAASRSRIRAPPWGGSIALVAVAAAARLPPTARRSLRLLRQLRQRPHERQRPVQAPGGGRLVHGPPPSRPDRSDRCHRAGGPTGRPARWFTIASSP
jgi:hypothetical protein